ncbi:2-succinyl-6-hydroxy-2,4-cyclohexadiene-1-carboxylate synthase [Chungangia koreensis]|uniref:Putative 2-succinyl-6-hydroxy-2,4-cyclohexadiene-1-carboxylate synthase n=1 Tax=Chungangia koreensis TaxID=752657 RepID=A0ABV8X4E6_9LACT
MVSQLFSIRGINVHVKTWNPNASRTLILLHGFTGSTGTWEETVSNLPDSIKGVAIDLIGHGRTDAPGNPDRYGMSEQITDLDHVFNALALEHFTLLGYSMGGRIALSYALRYPERIEKLILESSSPGLEVESERKQRVKADQSLADRIESEGLEEFVNYWEGIPLFQSQKALCENKLQDIRKERLSQRTLGLANSLRGIGTGKQPSNWGRLDTLKFPVLLITGELDSKFCRIAGEMKKQLPNAESVIVKGAGHAIHVEKSEQFATIITEHLKEQN